MQKRAKNLKRAQVKTINLEELHDKITAKYVKFITENTIEKNNNANQNSYA
jgi:hypothetical protein